MLLSLALAVALSQSDGVAAEAAPAAELSAAEKAAAAAQRAAEAAEKAAAAAQRIAESVGPATPAEKEDKKESGWVGNVGLGLAFITGNTQTLTLTANASADKKWENWAFGLRLTGAYGLANPTANVEGSVSQTTARRAAATVRGDRKFGGGFASIFVLGGSEFDHVKGIESRSVGEAGTGLTFFNKKEGGLERLYLRLDIAARAGYETRYQYFPTAGSIDPYAIVILAPRAAVTFRWAFSKDVRVSEELEFIPFVLAPEAGRLLINSNTKLSARITENLALTTALLINYDGKPPQPADPAAPRRLETDVALTVGVEAAF
jgi:putative salt-induced outer membrane protein YdiY